MQDKGARDIKHEFPSQLHTGRRFKLVIDFRTLRVEFLVDPGDLASRDDHFMLRSDDGSYEKNYSIADDKVPADDRCTFEYPRLRRGRRYTLIHDEGAGGVVYTIFEDRTFDELFPADDSQLQKPAIESPEMEAEEEEDAEPPFDDEDDDMSLDLEAVTPEPKYQTGTWE